MGEQWWGSSGEGAVVREQWWESSDGRAIVEDQWWENNCLRFAHPAEADWRLEVGKRSPVVGRLFPKPLFKKAFKKVFNSVVKKFSKTNSKS